MKHTTYNFDSFIKCTILFHQIHSQFCAAVNVVYFQLFSSPQEQNVNHEKSLPILCPPPPLPLSIHSSTSCIYGFSSVQLLSRVRLFEAPWNAARQATLSIANSRSLLKLMSIESVMPSYHLILCHHPLLLLPSVFSASGSFPMSQFFTSGGQSIGASISTSTFQCIFRTDFLQDWLVWCPCCPRDSQESSPTPQVKNINSSALSFLYSSTHIHPWLLEEP